MSGLTRRETLLGLGAAATLPLQARAQGVTFPPGAVIRTLFADISPESIAGGATMFHEHLSTGPDFMVKFRAANDAITAAETGKPAPPPPPPPATPARSPYITDVGEMVAELKSAQKDGVACLVDASLEGTGMDLAFIRTVAKASGLPIVKGAGFYSQPFYPKGIETWSEDQIVAALIKQADDYPAGAFGEIGSWDEITKTERKVFRAVGKAHLATNLPIFTHTGIPGKSAMEQLDIFEDAGVDPRRVCIGHLGNLHDPQVYVHKHIARRGAFVGIDRQGVRNDEALPVVMALIEAGLADHILISGDASRGYAKSLTMFVPKLKAAGASDEVLHRITVDNPRRFLAFKPKRPRKA